jgi:hypothetical protein
MAVKNQTDLLKNIRHIVLRITRVHFFFVLAYISSIIIFDSWNLIGQELVAWRWTSAGALFVVNTVVWYLCRAKLKSETFYMLVLMALLICDILFAAANVYWTRGMASKYVFLFVIPIISAGLSRSRSLLMAVTSISAAVYSISVVQYFNDNYGQGVKAELYGEIIFFSAMFFVIAWLMMIAFRRSAD